MVSKFAVADESTVHASGVAQWVVFLCHGDMFGIPLEQVREIVAPRPFTRLPGASREVCGLVGVRGRVITVIDLGTLLGGRPSAGQPEHRLLLLDIDGRRIGAAVDEVVTIAAAEVEATDGPVRVAAEASLGTGRVEAGTFAAVDPAILLNHVLH
jgi:purine-binding chemotaxis protein CheW